MLPPSPPPHPALTTVLPATLLTLVAFWFAIRATHGIHFLVFTDESSHLIGARAIMAGDRFDRDYIDAHGALVFMIAHLYGILFGWTDPLGARWASALAAILATAAVATSPVLPTLNARLWAATLFLGLITAPWIVQAFNTLDYYYWGGILVTIILAWLVMPAVLDHPPNALQSTAAGISLALLCICAYPLIPTALLLALSAAVASGRKTPNPHLKRTATYVAAGFTAATLVFLAWILRFGSLKGYLVFHIIDNQTNFGRYIPFGISALLHSLVPSTAPIAIVQSTATLACLAGFALLAILLARPVRARPRAVATAALLLLAAILMLNFRGSPGLQDGSFVVANFALVALLAPTLLSRWRPHPSLPVTTLATAGIAATLCAAELADRQALASPFNLPRADYIHRPPGSLALDTTAPIYKRIRQVLHPDERLLVLVYNPDLFFPAGYLPYRKFHGVLPWEMDYARNPWFGQDRNICQALATNPPPVIIYQPWIVWGKYDPAIFMPCVPETLHKLYVADPIPTLFIRRDRLPKDSSN